MRKCVFVISLMFCVLLAISEVQAQPVKIGVIQMVERPDFTLLRESFVDELQKKGYTVEVTVFNADPVTYPDTYLQRGTEEAKRMESSGMQLIFCPALYHAVVQANVNIPMIDGVMVSPDLLKLATVKDDGKMYC